MGISAAIESKKFKMSLNARYLHLQQRPFYSILLHNLHIKLTRGRNTKFQNKNERSDSERYKQRKKNTN